MESSNSHFNSSAMVSKDLKVIMEEFAETFEVDMHEFEKNIFCIAYHKGYADAMQDFEKSQLTEE